MQSSITTLELVEQLIDTVDAQQAQIQDLLTRVAALEQSIPTQNNQE